MGSIRPCPTGRYIYLGEAHPSWGQTRVLPSFGVIRACTARITVSGGEVHFPFILCGGVTCAKKKRRRDGRTTPNLMSLMSWLLLIRCCLAATITLHEVQHGLCKLLNLGCHVRLYSWHSRLRAKLCSMPRADILGDEAVFSTPPIIRCGSAA